MSESKEKYCIWTFEHGQMDTSDDWEKLFDLMNKASEKRWYYGDMWIIPVSEIGKGKFRTLKQMDEDLNKVREEHEEVMKLANEALRKADEILKR